MPRKSFIHCISLKFAQFLKHFMTCTVRIEEGWYVMSPISIAALNGRRSVQISVCAGLAVAGAMSLECGGNDASIVAAAALYDS